jgi:hypothetical protein
MRGPRRIAVVGVVSLRIRNLVRFGSLIAAQLNRLAGH